MWDFFLQSQKNIEIFLDNHKNFRIKAIFMEAFMRLRNGILTKLSNETGFTTKYLSALVSTKIRPGRARALYLETAAINIGRAIPAMLWLYGSSDEIKNALSNNVPDQEACG
jgi:hypothetical protein